MRRSSKHLSWLFQQCTHMYVHQVQPLYESSCAVAKFLLLSVVSKNMQTNHCDSFVLEGLMIGSIHLCNFGLPSLAVSSGSMTINSDSSVQILVEEGFRLDQLDPQVGVVGKPGWGVCSRHHTYLFYLYYSQFNTSVVLRICYRCTFCEVCASLRCGNIFSICTVSGMFCLFPCQLVEWLPWQQWVITPRLLLPSLGCSAWAGQIPAAAFVSINR